MNGQTAANSSAIARSALWAAWGDALGFPTELTRDETQVQRRLDSPRADDTRPWKRRIGGRQGAIVPLPAGMYSDDTQLRLSVSRCIRSAGRFDVEAFSKIELPVFLSYGFGIGRGTRAAAKGLGKQRIRWYSNFYGEPSAAYVESGGNGAAMRIQPHVWASPSLRPESYLPNVLRDAVVTHGHPRAIVGAALHAISLGATLRDGAVPAPPRWGAMAQYLRGLTELILDDEMLAQRWLPQWERATGESWTTALERVVAECEEMLTIAVGVATSRGSNSIEARYETLASKVGGLDPSTRGSGTISAVLALWLAWASGIDCANGLRTAANLLGSDTDTIASMAGALAGVAASAEPDGELADHEFLRAESLRLERLKTEGADESFPHPDPLPWQPPRTLSDAVGLIDGRVAVAGLGFAEEGSELYVGQGTNPGLWQWLHLEFGQSVLIKRRRELAPLPEYARSRVRPVVAARTQLSIAELSADEELPGTVEEGVELARRSIFDGETIARLFFHFARQPHGVSKASLFGGLLAQALAESAPTQADSSARLVTTPPRESHGPGGEPNA